MTRQFIAALALSLALVMGSSASAAPEDRVPGPSISRFTYRNITMHSMKIDKVAYQELLPILNFKLTNNGNKATGSFKMIYLIVVDGTQVKYGEDPYPQASLQPGETRTVSVWLPQVPFGSLQYYYVYANANFDHAVPETTYADNNIAMFTYQ